MREIGQLKTPRNNRKASPPKLAIHSLETLGLIIVVLLILAITITRSWHHINWSAR